MEYNFFCTALIRPDCLKETSLCCLFCDLIVKCQEKNTKKVKPCTTKNLNFDEKCEFSI